MSVMAVRLVALTVVVVVSVVSGWPLPQQVPGLANMELLKTSPSGPSGPAPLPNTPILHALPRFDVMLDYDILEDANYHTIDGQTGTVYDTEHKQHTTYDTQEGKEHDYDIIASPDYEYDIMEPQESNYDVLRWPEDAYSSPDSSYYDDEFLETQESNYDILSKEEYANDNPDGQENDYGILDRPDNIYDDTDQDEVFITTLERPLVPKARLSTDFTDYVILPLSDSTENVEILKENSHVTKYPQSLPSAVMFDESPLSSTNPASQGRDHSPRNKKELSAIGPRIGKDIIAEDTIEPVRSHESDMVTFDTPRLYNAREGRARKKDLQTNEQKVTIATKRLRGRESINYETVVPAPFDTIHKHHRSPQTSVSRSLRTQPYDSQRISVSRDLSNSKQQPYSRLNSRKTNIGSNLYSEGQQNIYTTRDMSPYSYQPSAYTSKRVVENTDQYYRASDVDDQESFERRVLRDDKHHSQSTNHFSPSKVDHSPETQQSQSSVHRNPILKSNSNSQRYLRGNQEEGSDIRLQPSISATSISTSPDLRNSKSAKHKTNNNRNPRLIPPQEDPRNRDEVMYYTGLQREIEKSDLLLDAIKDVRMREGKTVTSNKHKTTTTTITPVPHIEEVKSTFGEHPLYKNPSPKSRLKLKSHPITHREEYDTESDEYENMYLPVRTKSLELTEIQEVRDNFHTLVPLSKKRPHMSSRYPSSLYPNPSHPPVTTYKPPVNPEYSNYPGALALDVQHLSHDFPTASNDRSRSTTESNAYSPSIPSKQISKEVKNDDISRFPQPSNLATSKRYSSPLEESSTPKATLYHHSSRGSFINPKLVNPSSYSLPRYNSQRHDDLHTLKPYITRDQRSLGYTSKYTPSSRSDNAAINSKIKFSQTKDIRPVSPTEYLIHPTSSPYHLSSNLYYPTSKKYSPTDGLPYPSNSQTTRSPHYRSSSHHQPINILHIPTINNPRPLTTEIYPPATKLRPSIRDHQYQRSTNLQSPSSHLLLQQSPRNLHHPVKSPPRTAKNLRPSTSNLHHLQPSPKLHLNHDTSSPPPSIVRQKRRLDMETAIDANVNFPKFGYDIDPYFTDFPVFGFFDIDPYKER